MSSGWSSKQLSLGEKIGMLSLPLIADYKRRAMLKVTVWINCEGGDRLTLVHLNPLDDSMGLTRSLGMLIFSFLI